MMLRIYKQNEQGFTFVEILTCLAVVALIVGPICFSFLSSLKTKVTAESINEATAYAEKMLEDVKVQVTNDIILRQKIIGNRVATSSYNAIDKDGICNYLVDLSSGVSSRGSAPMTSFFKGTDTNALNSSYNTTDYAYELAIWRINDLSFVAGGVSTKKFTLDASTIGKAAKLYTDSNTNYQFNASKYTGIVNPITFEITDEMFKIFKDNTLDYVPNQSISEGAKKVADKNTITLKTDVNTVPPTVTDIENWRESSGEGNKAIKINKIDTIKDVAGSHVGYTFYIENGADATTFTSADCRSIIELDIRALLRDSTMATLTTYDALTFKFINNTDFDQLIVVKQNALESESIDNINEKFNIVALDKQNGKSSIVRIDDMNTFENYLIAIIVREKNPVLGTPGKIVKKLIDVFSYDITAYQRR